METIFALASAPGKAGVSVIRISGPNAKTAGINLAGDLPKARTAAVRILSDSNGLHLDEALVLVFESGASFTGEDVVELQVHGSVAVVSAILRELGTLDGLRMAEPGEFTRRAMDNGRLDLTQVEALSDLIEAETESQRKQALRILSGSLGKKVELWRKDIIRAAALLEATIDFADEEVPVDVTAEVTALLDGTILSIGQELSGLDAAESVRTGFEIAIVGPPNAGKSTLLNYLAGREAAITSEIAGTTRDIIEVHMDVKGLAVTFLDTAGLRETEDAVEKIGVERAIQRSTDADIRIHLVPEGMDPELKVTEGDLVYSPKSDISSGIHGISGVTGDGVSEMISLIHSVLSDRVSGSSLVNRERHRVVLRDGVFFLMAGRDLLASGPDVYDLVSEELRSAVRKLEALLGRVDVENLLDEIFSSFCVGK
ncbi:tRNA uridine-5-carboxymethylaminomethyl(34) synthesis GTPase MnmE [Pelagimonas varians]|uniref:tRNA modification GTPase MnmE n=1 Tax=Pelagimonas varians TaxID=696760 RepID=A0A238L4W2_9RHOB|nr:tRNA uridine-5-carboxymethylaminomethyl(34) synthesis GTPase MnmE [Pelagimonas varians]PYG26551.1 tRNA modification GTPase trmE [Pelagimonas varians]SMX49366.1 tRNA modification GTPase MnmE [Pelagimonas varians]